MRCHAASDPPGMIDGPKRAPSSPPETPQPTKFEPLSRAAPPRGGGCRGSASCRRRSRMSPASSSGASFAIISSTGSPAGTIIMIRRGRSSAATSSSSVFAPVNFAAGVIAEERVRPLGLEVPDDRREAVLLDVQREVAPHRPEPDDRRTCPLMPDISRADASACSNASRASAHRVLRRSATPALPSPSGTTRVEASRARRPRPRDSRGLRAARRRSTRCVALELHAPQRRFGVTSSSHDADLDRHGRRPAQARSAASRR